jgi:hypothetical protein
MPSLYTPASAPVFHVFGGTPTDTHRLPGGVHYPPPNWERQVPLVTLGPVPSSSRSRIGWTPYAYFLPTSRVTPTAVPVQVTARMPVPVVSPGWVYMPLTTTHTVTAGLAHSSTTPRDWPY